MNELVHEPLPHGQVSVQLILVVCMHASQHASWVLQSPGRPTQAGQPTLPMQSQQDALPAAVGHQWQAGLQAMRY